MRAGMKDTTLQTSVQTFSLFTRVHSSVHSHLTRRHVVFKNIHCSLEFIVLSDVFSMEASVVAYLHDLATTQV